MLVLLKHGKIQTLAPGATAPESRAPTPKDRNYWLDLVGMAWRLFSTSKEPQTNFLASADHHRGLFPLDSQGCQPVKNGRETSSERL